MASLRMAAPLNGAPFNGTWDTSAGLDPKTREEMGWPSEFEEWKSMKSMALAERLRAKDIKVQTSSDAVLPNGCFQENMLETLKIKEADIVHLTNQQQPLFLEKCEG